MDFLLNGIGVVGTIVLVVSYLPQIRGLYKGKDATGMSISFWVILILSLVCFFLNGLAVFIKYGDYGSLLSQSANILFATVVLCQVLYYNKKNKNTDNEDKYYDLDIWFSDESLGCYKHIAHGDIEITPHFIIIDLNSKNYELNKSAMTTHSSVKLDNVRLVIPFSQVSDFKLYKSIN